MRALDSHFNDRVHETSLGLGAIVFLALLGAADPYLPLCFGSGLALSLMMWRGARVLGAALTLEPPRARGRVRLVVVYLGRYAIAGLVLYGLTRSGHLDVLAFTGGFALVSAVLALKAVAWSFLPDQLDPAPIYSRDRKADLR